MKKSFDCVEMKRRGAERVYEETKDLTLGEEVEFWRRKSEELRANRSRREPPERQQTPDR